MNVLNSTWPTQIQVKTYFVSKNSISFCTIIIGDDIGTLRVDPYYVVIKIGEESQMMITIPMIFASHSLFKQESTEGFLVGTFQD